MSQIAVSGERGGRFRDMRQTINVIGGSVYQE
jgi:hypothetical protein